MQPEDSFDAFYASTRDAVLHQAFALTGDLRSARSGVRDAYAAAWRHWRKVSRLDDPLDWVRPRAWRLAQRRHRAHRWRRARGLSAGQRSVLDALSGLRSDRRRALLLVDLAGLDLDDAARELGVPRDDAERSLTVARSAVADAADVPPDRVGEALRSLAPAPAETGLPRAPLLRRAGRRKHRRHLLAGAVTAAAVAVTAGAVVYEPEPDSGSAKTRPSPSPSASPAAETPTSGDLLDGAQIGRLGGPQPWRVTRTDNNTAGSGLNSPCQQDRFADPRGYATLVRAFEAAGDPHRAAVQTVEVSRSVRSAERGYRTTLGWYAGCRAARVQVLGSYRVDGVGDRADVLTLRVWTRPVRTVTVAVARTGRLTTSTVSTTEGRAPAVGTVSATLAESVASLCTRGVAGSCVRHPTARAVPPPPSGDEPGILAVADLPPAGAVDRPWVGTRPTRPRANPSATTCDRAVFAGATRVRARTYLIPRASLPVRFGLSETYGDFRTPRAAAAFLAKVRGTVAGCAKRDLATEVGAEQRTARRSPQLDQSHWDLTTKVSDREKVRFHLGFVRVGDKVAQLTFSPTPGDDMPENSFGALLTRAGDRLRELG